MVKIKRIILIILCLNFLGCATLNFSSKYYTLPENYKKDIEGILTGIRIPITHSYPWSICIEECDRNASGIPFTDGKVIYLPKTFLQYVYEFYYNNRNAILTCVFLHEITHNEFNLPSKPPEQHYLCDKAVIERFFWSSDNVISTAFYTPNEMYSSLVVIKDYWYARKGLGGNLLNIIWNALNIVSLVYSGQGSIGDLYATDIGIRINLIKRDYPNVQFIFKRLQN